MRREAGRQDPAARRQARSLTAEVANGKDSAQRRQQERQESTFGDVFAQFERLGLSAKGRSSTLIAANKEVEKVYLERRVLTEAAKSR
jgi:hypothetical protein